MAEHLQDQLSFQRLANVYSQRIRRLVVFSGAGASREAGLPTWSGFIDLLYKQLEQHSRSSMGDAYVEGVYHAIESEPDPWKRVSILKTALGGYYDIAVRNILESFSESLPLFYRRIWDLDPDALLTVNLDGFSRTSYDARRTGHSADAFTGVNVTQSGSLLTSGRKLIVDLHGRVDMPTSWILSHEERDRLLGSDAYTEFLRTIMSSNTVIFYGLSIEDISVSGQISYLRRIGYTNGEYFWLKRQGEPTDWDLVRALQIQPIYLDPELSWEDGFADFVDKLLAYKAVDAQSMPVKSDTATSWDMPSPEALIAQSPDEIRLALNSATAFFYDGNNFDYKKYREFCDKYDKAIHLATRVNVHGENNRWMGKLITSELGKGNFGKVFSADDGLGGSVAIKVAHADVRDDAVMLDSFRRGVESMRILTESNISGVVGIVDASELPPSIIMDYVQGIDFEKYAVDYFHIDVATKIRIVRWISEILFTCHTHERFVLHRDLRPSNVMISGEYWAPLVKDQINVRDFDLSWYKGASGSEFYMNAAQALGYLAPEQLNKNSKYSTRTALVDVYGVGMLLYFILSIDVPLANASTRMDWHERVKSAARKAYNPTWKSSVTRVYQLIFRATREDQHLRPAMQEMIEEMDTIFEIFQKKYPLDTYSVLLELICRMRGGETVELPRGSNSATMTLASGINAHISTDPEGVQYRLEYTVSSSSNRTGRQKFLQNSLDKAMSALGVVAEIDRRKSTVELGRSVLVFSARLPTSIKEFENLERAATAAMSEMPVRT